MPEPGDHAAAWAVIVIGHGTGGDFILDCDYGLVVSEPMEQGWTGAQVSDARAAETAALIRAIEWTMYSGMEKPICFCFDAAAVGFAGTGTFRTGEADRHGRILRAMVAAIEKFLPPNCQPKWQHVKGHHGNVGNELADVVAKRCFRLQTERTLVARPDYVPYVCGKKFAIELLWLLFVQFRQCPSLPEISGHSMIMPQLRQPSDWTARVPTRLRQPTCYEEKSAFFRLFFATYNVASLGGRRGPYVVQYIKEQMDAHGLDLLCLQETRSRASSLIVSTGHLRVVSEAHQGHGGVELWLARRDAKGRPVFDKEHVQVLVSEPELQLVRARCRGVELLIVNGHAPHSGHSMEEIVQFWKRLETLVAGFHERHVHMIGGIDANAHFAESRGFSIGDFGLEERTDKGGDCFAAFLEKGNLFVPSTFEDIHEGGSCTWHNNVTGAGARCDYCFLPADWRIGKISSYLLPSLDGAQKGIDHTPLATAVQILLGKKVPQTTLAAFDRRRLQAADTETIDQIFEGIAIPDWDTDIDEHMTQITEQIHERLCNVFSTEKSNLERAISRMLRGRFDLTRFV